MSFAEIESGFDESNPYEGMCTARFPRPEGCPLAEDQERVDASNPTEGLRRGAIHRARFFAGPAEDYKRVR